MKKLALTAISLLIAGSASAADLRAPVRAPAPVPVVAYNWTGCYLGAGGGYGMFNQETQFISAGGANLGVSHDNGGRGWFGTVQVGCDYQIGSNIVIGAFADYDFAGSIKGDLGLASVNFAGEEKLKSSWAAGGRIGWLPFQQLLAFVSGGYTQARFSDVDFVFANTGGATAFSIGKHTYSGWFIGSGYEYGIGWLPGLFWKTEYRFADYGSERVDVRNAGVLNGQAIDFDKRVQTVRSELVWRFNFGGSPVVARY